jgi:hypothetical protein
VKGMGYGMTEINTILKGVIGDHAGVFFGL